MENLKENEPVCCPPFDPALWDNKVFEWENKRFIRDKVFTLFYMPVNFGQAMTRIIKKVDAAKASVPDWLCLSEHTSKWNIDVYLAVDKEIPGARNTSLSGKFFCRTYEGPFKDTGKWCEDFKEKAGAEGFRVKRMFMWYTTCPKCAKKYGKNYVAIIAQIE